MTPSSAPHSLSHLGWSRRVARRTSSGKWHFNAAGKRAFATWLHDELDRRELFPPGHRGQLDAVLAQPLARRRDRDLSAARSFGKR